jgi:hypothetical protein
MVSGQNVINFQRFLFGGNATKLAAKLCSFENLVSQRPADVARRLSPMLVNPVTAGIDIGLQSAFTAGHKVLDLNGV